MYSNVTFYGLILAIASFFLLSLYVPGPSTEIRGLYVNDFKDIIGKPEKEKELLTFAQTEGFNYLLLYNLAFIHRQLYDLTEPESAQALAQFIQKAKTEYGIVEVGAVGESAQSFEVIQAYNQLFASSLYSGIDVYNLEFECWNKKLVEDYYCHSYLEKNNLTCDKEGAFTFYLDQLKAIRKKAHAFNIKCETYIGKPTESQCAQIGAVCDRVLVHYYRKSDVFNNGNSIYQYQDYRLPALAPQTGVLLILPIFSARDIHMGSWLDEHSKEQAYQTFQLGQNGYQQAVGDWKKHLHIQGSQWYRYTDLVLH